MNDEDSQLKLDIFFMLYVLTINNQISFKLNLVID